MADGIHSTASQNNDTEHTQWQGEDTKLLKYIYIIIMLLEANICSRFALLRTRYHSFPYFKLLYILIAFDLRNVCTTKLNSSAVKFKDRHPP